MDGTQNHGSPLTRRGFLKAATLAAGAGALAGGLGRAAAAEPVGRVDAAAGKDALDIVIFLYDGMTVLDAIGPYEVLRFLPNARVRFAAKKAGLIEPDSGVPVLHAAHAIADIERADILLLPGGDAGRPARDEKVLEWVRRIHKTTKWTTSVCVGSLILGAAGLLKGLEATSHWNTMDALPLFGAKPVNERVVRQGKILTAAGVSAGIDMALTLAALEAGDETAKTIQLLIEYDPRPPFDSGSKAKATPGRVEKARKILAALFAPKA